MPKGKHFKHLIVLVCLFFCWATLMAGPGGIDTNTESPEKDSDILLKARMLIREGHFDAAITELQEVIEKLKPRNTNKRDLGEAYYLLARVYKVVQLTEQFNRNLDMAFKIYPGLNLPEPDPEIREAVSRLKEKWAVAKEQEAQSKIITRMGVKKKKKFPVLLVAAGVVAVTVAILLLTKKKKSGNGDYDTAVLGIQWVDIPAGEFMMGDKFNEGWSDEVPVHSVSLSAFKMAKHEITYEQYDTFCDETSRNKPDDFGWGRGTRPVTAVSWTDADAFCQWLAQKTGKNIHLPYEAQWERAARGINAFRFPWGDDAPSCDIVNFNSCTGRTMPVGSYPGSQTAEGVRDMAGNIYEWCADWYDPNYYASSPTSNPTGPASGTQRVHRGGSWFSDAEHIRATDRDGAMPSHNSNRSGFRVCQD